jgi:hypothetical protein
MFGNDVQGAIMAVGASKPTVVADADGFFSVKSKMLVSLFSIQGSDKAFWGISLSINPIQIVL